MKETYIYSSENRFLKPHKYMYTKFIGKNFVIDYKKDRKKRLEDLCEFSFDENKSFDEAIISYLDKPRSFFIPKIPKFKDKEEVSLGIIIIQIINQIRVKLTAKEEKIIYKIIQRFEVSKVFYEKYDKNLKKGFNKDLSPVNYLYFSYCLCIAYVRHNNKQFLSTLLKVNDLLLSLDKSEIKVDCDVYLLFLVINYEMKCIEKLLVENDINL